MMSFSGVFFVIKSYKIKKKFLTWDAKIIKISYVYLSIYCHLSCLLKIKVEHSKEFKLKVTTCLVTQFFNQTFIKIRTKAYKFELRKCS